MEWLERGAVLIKDESSHLPAKAMVPSSNGIGGSSCASSGMVLSINDRTVLSSELRTGQTKAKVRRAIQKRRQRNKLRQCAGLLGNAKLHKEIGHGTKEMTAVVESLPKERMSNVRRLHTFLPNIPIS
jgi:hypothetical protein